MNIDKTFASSSALHNGFVRYVDISLTPNPDTWDAPASFAGFGVSNYRVFPATAPIPFTPELGR